MISTISGEIYYLDSHGSTSNISNRFHSVIDSLKLAKADLVLVPNL